MLRFTHAIMLLVLMTWMSAVAHARPIIAADGKANAQIVIADQPPRSVKLAASELQHYIEKITRAKLAIVTKPTDDAAIKIYVGQSDYTQSLGVTADGLEHGSYHIVSGDNWLALIGDDKDFVPTEPWARSYGQQKQVEAEWDKLTGHHWKNIIAMGMYRRYSRELDLWAFDHCGSLNAVCGFLKSLGVRWYMPGDLGEILPSTDIIVLPEIKQTVQPDMKERVVNYPMFAGQDQQESVIWALRLGVSRSLDEEASHHGLRYINERTEQRENHPEFYQLINGVRDTKGKTANECLSGPLFDETVSYARAMFDHYPDLTMLAVSPADGFNLICQCDLCRDQATPERGGRGWLSDYQWGFVNRVAKEVGKTHPDRYILSGAYSGYTLPPLNIDKFEPNVKVCITNGRPRTEMSEEARQASIALRQAWAEKLHTPLAISMNWPFTQCGEYRPQYFPHIIAQGARDVKGQVQREDMWLPQSRDGLFQPGMNHLNAYVISQFWWDADQDVDVLLKEYYQKFYGPAAEQMKAFIEYSEANYTQIAKDQSVANHVLGLFDKAKAAADSDSVYGQRLALVDQFLETLRKRSTQMGKGRDQDKIRKFSGLIDLKNDKWRDARESLVMDGKLDEPFWTAYPHGGSLVEQSTGDKPKQPTTFYTRWWQDKLYLGIRCAFDPADPPIFSANKNGDRAIWAGEHVEILLETGDHSYYQIVVNPAGAILSLDRGVARRNWFEWDSGAQAAAYIGKDFWSVEIRIPVSPNGDDPLHTVIGNKPVTDMPWYFNIFRQTLSHSGGDPTNTVFAPSPNLHDVLQFGKLWDQRD